MPDLDTLSTLMEDSIADERLQTQEKNHFEQALISAELKEEDIRRLRNQAFDLAQQKLTADNGKNLLKWLEKLVRTLDKARPQMAPATGRFSPGQECLQHIVHYVNNARATLDICVFTITDNRIGSVIVDAAERGVAVRIISDNDKAHDKGSDIHHFQAQGIPVRLDRTPNHMHHKYAVIDGRYLINGSFNWTRSATDHNHENIVVHQEPGIIAVFQERFNDLWAKFE